MDERDFRRGLGSYPTGVAVVTARSAGGRAAGVTINSFASVSLRPPLVLWSLAARAPSRPAFEAATYFAIHVLAGDQRVLAERFCSPAADKFTGVATGEGLGGAPLLENAAALFECRARHSYPGGDHVILIGEVERYAYFDRPPLVFHGGRYGALAELEQDASCGETAFDAWESFYHVGPAPAAAPKSAG
ncbi:MAG: flavin reductase family protein [Burkholderiales bacterium]|nr:flavin reductase family protein [Burkholderiales bacterium]